MTSADAVSRPRLPSAEVHSTRSRQSSNSSARRLRATCVSFASALRVACQCSPATARRSRRGASAPVSPADRRPGYRHTLRRPARRLRTRLTGSNCSSPGSRRSSASAWASSGSRHANLSTCPSSLEIKSRSPTMEAGSGFASFGAGRMPRQSRNRPRGQTRSPYESQPGSWSILTVRVLVSRERWPTARLPESSCSGDYRRRRTLGFRPVANFEIGDRVERCDQKLEDCGTVVAILSDGPAGASYMIDWDNHPGQGPCAEILLQPCTCG